MKRRDVPMGAKFRYVGIGLAGWPKTADGDSDIGLLSGSSFRRDGSESRWLDYEVELLTDEQAAEALAGMRDRLGI